MTEENNELQNVQVSAPMVTVTLHGQADQLIDWVDLDEHDEHNPATISDDDLLTLVANHMDIASVEELGVVVYGNRDGGKIIASRSETGNITVRPPTTLGK